MPENVRWKYKQSLEEKKYVPKNIFILCSTYELKKGFCSIYI